MNPKDLVSEFKRSGKFDKIRKQMIDEYSQSPSGQQLYTSLCRLASETDATSKPELIGSLGKSNLFNSKRSKIGSELFESLRFKDNLRHQLNLTLTALNSKELASQSVPKDEKISDEISAHNTVAGSENEASRDTVAGMENEVTRDTAAGTENEVARDTVADMENEVTRDTVAGTEIEVTRDTEAGTEIEVTRDTVAGTENEVARDTVAGMENEVTRDTVAGTDIEVTRDTEAGTENEATTEPPLKKPCLELNRVGHDREELLITPPRKTNRFKAIEANHSMMSLEETSKLEKNENSDNHLETNKMDDSHVIIESGVECAYEMERDSFVFVTVLSYTEDKDEVIVAEYDDILDKGIANMTDADKAKLTIHKCKPHALFKHGFSMHRLRKGQLIMALKELPGGKIGPKFYRATVLRKWKNVFQVQYEHDGSKDTIPSEWVIKNK